MWTGPCAVFVPGGSGAELELMLAGSPLPQGMLAAWWEVREATPEPSVSRGFWTVWVPRCWSRTLMAGSKLIPSLISVHCPIQMCVYVPVCVAVCVCVFLIITDTTLDLSQKAEKRCVCIPVCVPVYVCVHHWVLETAGKISLLVDLFLVMTSSLVCSSCS